MEEKSDRALIEECLRGDTRAFDKLVRRYSGTVYAIVYAISLDNDAEDVA